MIFCYGLSVNGVPVISSIWLCKRDPIFSFLLILSLFLSLPVLAMFFIDLCSPIKTEDSKETYRTDTLIEKADAYWTKGAENKQKNYRKAEQLYLHILKGNPQDFRALSMYALMLFEQRRYDEADVIYESMNRLDSGTAKIVADNYSKIEGCEEREKYWRKKSKNSKVV